MGVVFLNLRCRNLDFTGRYGPTSYRGCRCRHWAFRPQERTGPCTHAHTHTTHTPHTHTRTHTHTRDTCYIPYMIRAVLAYPIYLTALHNTLLVCMRSLRIHGARRSMDPYPISLCTVQACPGCHTQTQHACRCCVVIGRGSTGAHV